jgi:tRNA (mo5U34)-methyltransferase
MLRSAGFRILEHPEEEVFICRAVAAEHTDRAVYPGRSSINGKARGDKA